MKQSRAMSAIESTINIVVGFGISFVAQIVFLPMLGVAINLTQNTVFAVIMTVISLARSYLLRRLFEALHIRAPISPAAMAIIAERQRQIDVEGWDPAHDDRHPDGELAQAGAAYALNAALAAKGYERGGASWKQQNRTAPTFWPWERRWWKPQDFRRDLVRAGALILAELDRDIRNRKRPETRAEPTSEQIGRVA